MTENETKILLFLYQHDHYNQNITDAILKHDLKISDSDYKLSVNSLIAHNYVSYITKQDGVRCWETTREGKRKAGEVKKVHDDFRNAAIKITIFISYLSIDSHKKNALKKAIARRAGMEPIVVEDYRQSGVEFTEKVRNDLKRANYFVPIISSKSYQKSQWLNQEIGFAFATFPKENILPVVQKSIIGKLKGFIHDKAEISYNFDVLINNEKKNRANFRKAIKSLLDDIEIKENLRSKTGLLYKKVEKREYAATTISVNYNITEELRLFIRITQSSLQQDFRFYYRVVTDNNEQLWIGFTNKELNGLANTTSEENTQQVEGAKKLTYDITNSILRTVNERINMQNDANNKISGKPSRVMAIRFRGNDKLNEPIDYYYAFK